ncbi:hypothetical protein [Pseudomonas helleri]|uniref:hypothetical protein n=1 Tax=Pseudomonas helleri TaxID=1608996 RepID=UPI0028E4B530|nr:hypothetical protein [Pseudomonas helleri]
MSLNTADKIFLAVGLIDFAGIFIWIGVCLHLAYTQMDLMLDHLKNSALINTFVPLRQGGPWGRLVLIGSISSVIAFPGFYLKRGSVNAEDLRCFTGSLKRKLVMLQWGGLILLVVMVCIGVVAKLGFV